MSFRRELAVSFAVQGAGAAAVLLATVWLGAALGPQVQGGFSQAKSQLEFIGAFAAFGLPQALFFHTRSGRLGLAAALRWTSAVTALAWPIGVVFGLGFGGLAGRSPATVALLGLPVVAFVAHAQLRSLLLVRERATRFNLATALPQWLTLAGVGLVIAWVGRAGPAPDPMVWSAIFLVAYGATAGAAWRALAGTAGRPTRRLDEAVSTSSQDGPVAFPATDGPPFDISAEAQGRRSAAPAPPPAEGALPIALLRYGLAAWLTAALATGAILAAQRWVEADAGAAALGRFTMAMTLTQVPLTPIAYAAPLLFRRWIHTANARAARRWSALLAGSLLGVAALVGLAAFWRDDLGLGAGYRGATAALALLLVGGAAEAAARVLGVQASAAGSPGRVLRAEGVRATVLLLGWLALGGSAGVLQVCTVWAAGAVGAALLLVWQGRPGVAALPEVGGSR